jgi:hypothetical protein
MPFALCSFAGGDVMRSILDQMEEHIAAIRNLQRNFDFHSKRLEKLMRDLKENHLERNSNNPTEEQFFKDQAT